MLRVLLALGNILRVHECCVLHNVGIYCLRFLETAYRLLDQFGLHWIKFFNWLLQACYDLRVDAVNQIVNTMLLFVFLCIRHCGGGQD